MVEGLLIMVVDVVPLLIVWVELVADAELRDVLVTREIDVVMLDMLVAEGIVLVKVADLVIGVLVVVIVTKLLMVVGI